MNKPELYCQSSQLVYSYYVTMLESHNFVPLLNSAEACEEFVIRDCVVQDLLDLMPLRQRLNPICWQPKLYITFFHWFLSLTDHVASTNTE